MNKRTLSVGAISLTVIFAAGFAAGYYYSSKRAETLAVIDEASRIRASAALLSQMQRGDIEQAKSAHRGMIEISVAALNVLAPVGSDLASLPEVKTARATASEALK